MTNASHCSEVCASTPAFVVKTIRPTLSAMRFGLDRLSFEDARLPLEPAKREAWSCFLAPYSWAM
jgi:hypothetical protein